MSKGKQETRVHINLERAYSERDEDKKVRLEGTEHKRKVRKQLSQRLDEMRLNQELRSFDLDYLA